MDKETARRYLRAHLYGALVIGTFVVILPVAVRTLDPLIGAALPAWLRYVGAVILPAGAVLSYVSFWLFMTRGRGTAFPDEPPQVLVAAGPYRTVRNPMYVGNLAMLFGEALLLASPSLLVYAASMCIVAHVYITRAEEPALAARYGEPYLQYLATTPQWVPGAARPISRAAAS